MFVFFQVFFHTRAHGGILFWWRRSTASLRSIYVSAGVRPEAWDGRARSANLRFGIWENR